MTKQVATYTAPENGRQVYFRSGVPFPHGVAVELDAAAIGKHGMTQIEQDPRLKVSNVSGATVKEAAASDVVMTEAEVEAFTGRILATFEGLPKDGYTQAGLPRVPFVRDALPEADRAHVTAELVEQAWARRAATAT